MRETGLRRYRVETPYGTFQTVTDEEVRFAVVYAEQRAGRSTGFCRGWCRTVGEAGILAEDVRQVHQVEAMVVAVEEVRLWKEPHDRDLEEKPSAITRVGLRAGVRYQSPRAYFDRTGVYQVLDAYEWVEARRLALEPGSVGVFRRASGEIIIVRYEDDIRDPPEPGEPATDQEE